MNEAPAWLTQFVNHHLGHFALALLAALHIQPTHPERPIPEHVVMAFVAVIIGTIFALVLRSSLASAPAYRLRARYEASAQQSRSYSFQAPIPSNLGLYPI